MVKCWAGWMEAVTVCVCVCVCVGGGGGGGGGSHWGSLRLHSEPGRVQKQQRNLHWTTGGVLHCRSIIYIRYRIWVKLKLWCSGTTFYRIWPDQPDPEWCNHWDVCVSVWGIAKRVDDEIRVGRWTSDGWCNIADSSDIYFILVVYHHCGLF